MPSINLKKLWRRKSVSITECDPTYKVIYLGNVLTGWAKGDGCVEKPLATLWRNYCQSSRPDISMKVTICGAGLRAVTQEHGLTEYWAHRVTHCSSHPSYPRVFCWVYRHEGRRLKQELRCHAVLCPKQGKAELMTRQLKERLSIALHEFRREKVIRQNARLSVTNAIYDCGSLPIRKVYLVTGVSNYRPPLERSKSAPKLGAIEEEEEEPEAIIPSLIADTPISILEAPSSLIRAEERPRPSSPRLFSRVSPPSSRLRRRLRNQKCSTSPVSSSHLFSQEEDSPPPEPQISLLHISAPDLFFSSSDMALHDPPESLTSDQPESIASSSCSSSDGGQEDEDGHESPPPPLSNDLLIETNQVLLKETRNHNNNNGVLGKKADLIEEEEDNISEESGYSEEKECIDNAIKV